MVSPIHVHLSEGENWDEKSVEAMIQKSEQYVEEADTAIRGGFVVTNRWPG
jgi:hypothetical protein